MADADADGQGKPKLLRSLWYMTVLGFRADPWRSAAALAVTTMASTSRAAGGWAVSRIIGAAIDGDAERAVAYVLLLAIVGSMAFFASMVSLDLRFRMEEATTLLVDQELVAITAGIPGLEHHERPEHLDRMELLRSQRRLLGGSVAALIENFGVFVSIVTTVGLLVSIDPLLILLPAFGIPSILASARTRAWYKKAEEDTAERVRLTNHFYDLATTGAPAKELRVFGLRHEIRDRFTAVTEDVHREMDRITIRSTVLTTAGWGVFAVGYIAAIAMVATKAVDGRAEPEDVALIMSLAGQVNEQVGGVYWMVGWLLDTLKTVGRFLRLMDDAAEARPEIADPSPPPDLLATGITLTGVGFRYPGTDVDVLSGVDLHIPPGTTVAIVGDNGAGKSTLVKLLSRFYDPTEGTISVDDVDLRRIPVDDWRTRMSAGFQDFAKLELIARETVGVGDLASIDDVTSVETALARASASDVTASLADGLESQLGRSFDGGVELSGGQWQKLALGRAMMRDRPLLLVLDEPTAALDADTEHALFERYAGAAKTAASEVGGITVLVSHRFSTVRMADMIVVVGDGAIVEQGSHAELMTRGGLYAELYELQARAYR